MIQKLENNKKASLRYLSLDKVVVFLYALYTFRGAWLAFDHGGYLPWFELFSLMVAQICVPAGLLFCVKNRYFKSRNLILLIIPLFYWLLQVFHTDGGYSGGWELSLITIALFILIPDDIKKRVFALFYRMFLVAAVVSILIWICYFAGINIGFQRELYYSQRAIGWTYYYYRWFIFAIFNDRTLFRLCGLFNEPGALGTLCALLFICTNKKSKQWEKVILIVTGVLTFSLAFFLLIFMYEAIKICLKRPRNILFVFLFVALFFAIPHIDFHNELLNQTAARFALTDSGLAGDNRVSGSFEIQYDAFIHSSDMWFGKGAGYDMGGANLSWKSHYIVPYGIVGTVVLLGIWLCAALSYGKGNREKIIYIFLFFASLYQRPAVIENILGYILLFGALVWMSNTTEGQSDVEAV